MHPANSADPEDKAPRVSGRRLGVDPAFADLHLLNPLDPDERDDLPLVTTVRGLLRIATAAADAATRFSAADADDPVSWMIRPSPLFGGRSALEACLGREGFEAATLCNGLLLAPDVDAARLPRLLLAMRSEGPSPAIVSPQSASDGSKPVRSGDRTLRLFTCFVEGGIGRSGRRLQAFCAMTAEAEEEVRRRLGERYGRRLAKTAAVSEGFDDRTVLAAVLLSGPIARMLADAARDPSDCHGLDVAVEQRFAA